MQAPSCYQVREEESSQMPSLFSTHPPGLIAAVLDEVGVALAVVDKDGHIVSANRAAHRMLGEEVQIAGTHFADVRRAYRFQDAEGRDIPIETCMLTRLLAGEAVEPQDLHVILPDGRSEWLHGAGHKFSVAGLTGVLMVITDETEQVELRKAAEQFHRLEAAAVLAGGLAHDFNNMLAVVSENANMALADPGVPETTSQRLQQMLLALRKGRDLVGRLVQFSQRQDLEKRLVQMNEVIATSLELVRPMIGKNVHLRTELRPSLPLIEAAAGAIEQVLVNLLLNAIDAMPQGGELALQTDLAGADAVNHHEGERPEGFVSVSVSDSGVGIPEGMQAIVFEPFFTTKPPGKGAGLGLATSYGIIRQHQGSIKVQSRPGDTKFTIYLPVTKKFSPANEAA
jgi:two-component system cell cycle sensor histidine kinase/response regulator CckA